MAGGRTCPDCPGPWAGANPRGREQKKNLGKVNIQKGGVQKTKPSSGQGGGRTGNFFGGAGGGGGRASRPWGKKGGGGPFGRGGPYFSKKEILPLLCSELAGGLVGRGGGGQKKKKIMGDSDAWMFPFGFGGWGLHGGGGPWGAGDHGVICANTGKIPRRGGRAGGDQTLESFDNFADPFFEGRGRSFLGKEERYFDSPGGGGAVFWPGGGPRAGQNAGMEGGPAGGGKKFLNVKPGDRKLQGKQKKKIFVGFLLIFSRNRAPHGGGFCRIFV